jgi:hypothetical protein
VDLAPEEIHSAIAILADINLTNILFFSTVPYTPGQSIVLRFNVTSQFIVGAEVVASKNFNLRTRVISEERHGYRIQAKFTFNLMGEKACLRNFLKQIEPSKPVIKKKTKKEDKEEFEDLDL